MDRLDVVRGTLYFLRDYPDLLPPVIGVADVCAMERRLRQRHPCLLCGDPLAHVAIVAHSRFGARWLDACAECYDDVLSVNDQHWHT